MTDYLKNFFKTWVQEKAVTDLDALEVDIFDRVLNVTDRYKGRIPDWDIFNEVVHGSFFKDHYGDDIWDRVIDLMKEIDPDVKIVFNDYHLIAGDYHKCFLNYIKGTKPKMDAIGLQSHVSLGFEKGHLRFIRLSTVWKS